MSKERLIALEAQKTQLENEIHKIYEELNKPGMPGVTGSLIDSEGFPLQGIDHYKIRQQRQKYHVLNNDYTKLMQQIEYELANYFGSSQTPQRLENTNRTQELSVGVSVSSPLRPFAEVTEVSSGSPARESGIKEKDLVVKFGPIDFSNHENLSALARVVQENLGQSIPVLVRRKNAVNEEVEHPLEITPNTWAGPGLLGCRFNIVN